jgi:hypothetical protein
LRIPNHLNADSERPEQRFPKQVNAGSDAFEPVTPSGRAAEGTTARGGLARKLREILRLADECGRSQREEGRNEGARKPKDKVCASHLHSCQEPVRVAKNGLNDVPFDQLAFSAFAAADGVGSDAIDVTQRAGSDAVACVRHVERRPHRYAHEGSPSLTRKS